MKLLSLFSNSGTSYKFIYNLDTRSEIPEAAARAAALQETAAERGELSAESIQASMDIARAVDGLNVDTRTAEYKLSYRGVGAPVDFNIPLNSIVDADHAASVVEKFAKLFEAEVLDVDNGEIFYLADDSAIDHAELRALIGLDDEAPARAVVDTVAPVVPSVVEQAALIESADNIYPTSDYLSVKAQNHISQALSTASFDRAGATAEFEANLSYTFEAVDATHHDALKTAVNQMVTDLIDVRFDQDHNGTNHADWRNFQEKYETQLSLFIDDPANITAYLTDNPVLPESVGTDVSAEQITAQYGPAGVEALVRAALPADEALAVLRLGYSQDIAPERMKEMAQLVGMMSASITKFEQQIQNFPQFDSPYNQISITELTDIKDRVLRGFNILESPADLADVNQRIQSMSQIVEAYVDEDLSSLETAEQQAQHKRLSDFIDSYEAQLGNRNPQALSAARAALLTGEIDAAITATENLVTSGLNANVVDLVSSFQISSAQMPDGTLITADMIANDDTALFQAIRYMNDFTAAGEVAQENIVNTDAIVGAHVLDYVSNNEARFNAQAETSVQGYLDQLASSDPVGYQVMLQQIEANGGRQNLVENFAKEMTAIEGFKDYVDNNHGAAGNPEMLELYANMEGYGALVFSDATVDVLGGVLAQTLLTGPAFYQSIAKAGARGLTRVGAALPTRQALMAQGRVFLRSEASGIGRAMADDVVRVSDDLGTAAFRVPISPSDDLISMARHATPDEFRTALARAVPDRPVMSLADDTLEGIQAAARTNKAHLAPAIDDALMAVDDVVISAASSPARARALFSGITGLPSATANRMSGLYSRMIAARGPQLRVAAQDMMATVRTLSATQQRQMAMALTAAAVTPIVAPMMPELFASAEASPATPGVDSSVVRINPSTLSLPDRESAPVIDTTTPEPLAAEAEPALTVSEQIAELTPEGFASLGAAISNIFKDYEDYTSGQWREITDKVAALDGITLSTDEERQAYGSKLQAYIRTKLNISDEDADENLTDGSAGPDTMSNWRLAQMSFTPDEFSAQAESLQNFSSLSTWQENNIAIANLMGLDLSNASVEDLRTFGRSYQAFAYGRAAIDSRNDGKIGRGTLSADDDKFAALDNA